MGSVADDYRCPWCGRVGDGGYALDGLEGGPMCTEGEYSCLHFQALGRGYGLAEFRVRQLQAMFPPNHMWAQFVPGNVWELVVSFLD